MGIGVPAEDGIYKNCSCGYTIKEPHVGFFGTSDEKLFKSNLTKMELLLDVEKMSVPVVDIEQLER